jgi:hypothetical protein
VNSQQLADRAAITYRQLDNWVRLGWLKPDGGGGTGRPREFPVSEAIIACRMAELVVAGLRPDRAAVVARGGREATEKLLAAIAPCVEHGELVWRWRV